MTVNTLFLLGLMRSGTTFFRNVLSANNNIQVLGSELNKFWTEIGQAPCGTVPQCPVRIRDDATEEISSAVQKWFAQNYQNRNSLYNLTYRTYRLARYGNQTLLKYGDPYYLLNKSTHLNNKIAFVDRIFPEAKFIFIIRDIYSHSNSLYRHLLRMQRKGYTIYPPDDKGSCWGFVPDREKNTNDDISGNKTFSFEDVPAYWFQHNLIAIKVLAKLAQDRVFYIQFDDIVRDLPSILHRLGQFLHGELNQKTTRKLINNYTVDPLEEWKETLTERQMKAIDNMIETNRNDYEYIYSFFPDMS
ncbi:MAG: sulfotransferase family protein [Desulfurivibrionaceae bacterium]